MDKILHKDFQMLIKCVDMSSLIAQQSTVFVTDAGIFYNYPVKNDNLIKYLKLYTCRTPLFEEINLEKMLNLEFLEISSKENLYNFKLDKLKKLRTLAIENNILSKFDNYLNFPPNMENLILMMFMGNNVLPNIKIDNLPVSTQRIIFYSNENDKLKLYIKKKINTFKIPFNCKIYVDKTEIF